MQKNGWKRAFPMERKAQAVDALSLLYARDGVPAAVIMDGSKEQTLLENSRRKLDKLIAIWTVNELRT